MRRFFVLAIFALLCTPALAKQKGKVAVPVGKDAGIVHSIDGNVYQVLTGGWWCDAGSEGPYRFIVLSNGSAQTEHNLYLQLLAAEGGKTRGKVVKTVPVIETTTASLFFEDLKLRDPGRCATIVLEGNLQRRIGAEDRFERMRLKAFQNGDYLATFESEVFVTPTPRARTTPAR